MATTVQKTITGSNGITVSAKAVMAFDELREWATDQALKRLMLVAEMVKVQVQKNVSKSSRGFGPSQPGEYPHANTGLLRNSIFWEVNKAKLTVEIGTNLGYGIFLEHGTQGGRIIVPKQGKALSWVDPLTGARHFAKQVITKGMQPRSFLKRTLVEMTDKIRKIVAMPFDKIPSRATV